MFEVGHWYIFRCLENGVETSFTDKVIEVETPLIKLHNAHGNTLIYNTHNTAFVSAERIDDPATNVVALVGNE